jgi:hypothetical protein
VLVVLMVVLVAGCIVIPATAKVSQSGDVQAPSGAIALSVLFSSDFSPGTSKRLGDEMVECVTHGLAEAAPEVRLVPEVEFYRAVFGLKPGEVLLQADTIRTLLARPDIRQRAGESSLTHLILVGGATHAYSSGKFDAGGLGGAAYTTRSTRLTASIFDLTRGAEVGAVEATAEGPQGGAVFQPIFIFAWFSSTESSSCNALGAEVARAIRGRPRDESR